ncbi:MAG: hypothetical protein WKG00_02625 [Polyangiaceae bacterium]
MTEALRTSVGHGGYGDSQYFGYALLAELAGRDGFFSVLALALGGRRLTRDEEALLDDASTCALSPDPRIWPLKIVRLVSSFGGTLAGLAAGVAWLEGARVGPWPAGDAAELLRELKAIAAGEESASALRAAVQARLDAGARFPGFGVPFRDEDERVVALGRCVDRRGFSDGAHWQLVIQLDALMVEVGGPRLNIDGAIAAVALDLGMAAEQVRVLTTVLLLNNLVANAVEGAAQRPGVLRRLPQDAATYAGPPPRLSPRAAQARDAAR